MASCICKLCSGALCYTLGATCRCLPMDRCTPRKRAPQRAASSADVGTRFDIIAFYPSACTLFTFLPRHLLDILA